MDLPVVGSLGALGHFTDIIDRRRHGFVDNESTSGSWPLGRRYQKQVYSNNLVIDGWILFV